MKWPFPQARGVLAWCIVVVLALGTTSGLLRGAEKIADSAHSQIAALIAEKEGRTAAQQKMDSQLVYFVKKNRDKAALAAIPKLIVDVKGDERNRVLVDIRAVVSPQLRDFITGSGGTVIAEVAEYGAVRALLPATAIEPLAGRNDVRFVEPAVQAMNNVGTVLDEGVRCHRVDTARATLGADGTGLKIGVLSSGVDSLAASKANGNLNAYATFLSGQAGSGDEGTAMMEIIQDMLPGAQLIFATSNGGTANMASNIQKLQAAGCSVMVDDVSYFNESPFQDQVICQAVTTVSNAGVLYFSSARNSGNKDAGTAGTWEGDFADGGAAGAPVTTVGNLHDFGGGTTYDTVATGGSSPRVDFFWTDPLGGSTNDYDLFVLDSTGADVLRSSTNIQNGTQDPYESVSTLNSGERIVIVKKTGAAARFLHLDTGRMVLTVSTPGNVRGHNCSTAANAFSVAATSVKNSPSPGFFVGGATNPVETFSSDGPRRMFFDPTGTALTPGNFSSTGGVVFNKPDITAADAVSTSVSGFSPFSGTSAAAPHAAAIAALIEAYNPSLTPAQIRSTMASTALDIGAAGFDRDSGSGIAMGLPALQATAAPDALTIGETGLDASGPTGGPFTPTTGTYTLTNTGSTPVNWTAASTQSWNVVAPASGTLAAGASSTVTCALNTTGVSALASGNYVDTVTITNTPSGFSRPLSVSLALAAAPTASELTVLPNDNFATASAHAPSTRYTYARAVYLITAAELAAHGLPNGASPSAIGWTYSAAPATEGSAPLKIYLQNTTDTTNTKGATWTTAISGMTMVHSATTTLPSATGAFDIAFSGGSAFTYTGGGLYVAFDWGQYTGTLSTTAAVLCNGTGLTNGILTGQSTNTTVPNNIGASSTRPETRLTSPYLNSPMVTTPTSANLTSSTATLGGDVTQTWGVPLTARGVVYAATSVNPSPQLGGTGVTNVTGSGSAGVFTVTASGLSPQVQYSFAAYAANSAGTVYTNPSSTLTTLNPGIADWRFANFGTTFNSGNLADNASYAGDGIANLLKYGLGLNPLTNFTSGTLPGMVNGSNNALLSDRLALAFTIPNPAPPDVTYLVQTTTDLFNWTTVASKTGTGVWSWTAGGAPHIVENDGANASSLQIGDSIPSSGQVHRFLRLEVTGP